MARPGQGEKSTLDRRGFLLAAAAGGAALHPAIARALAIDAKVRTGTIADVEHVVILMQENRGFDHYFGALPGVRGFADRFPIPVPDTAGRKAATVWVQANAPKTPDGPKLIAPFPLDTVQHFAHMRVEGTPHGWPDTQAAWNEGRMDRWPVSKTEHAMVYCRRGDAPFQYAIADAFTLCDAYHCSIQTGTNSNRLYLWTGTNDPGGKSGGPSIANSHDHFPKPNEVLPPYTWTTYPERLQAAGISWRHYQDMADNFGDNPLVGFKAYRDANARLPGSDPALLEKALTTYSMARLRQDVMDGSLPQVSWIVGTTAGSEHPGPSSPAQGADYTAQVMDALTSNPKVWAKTVFLVMYDENDGFFDHMPPPSPPSRDAAGKLKGGSTVDLTGEHHLAASESDKSVDRADLRGRPYGLGPRVPLYVISPWSRGGYVNSQVFDHTSVIRFLETRFGVKEPNISPWRRAVCGDLTSAFDFKTPNGAALPKLPATKETAARAAALPGRTTPPTPLAVTAPVQEAGVRPSRALPYALDAVLSVAGGAAKVAFVNEGAAGAVFHVYDRHRLGEVPRRYTVEAGKRLEGSWPTTGGYDLWVLGPNGFHRHFKGGSDVGPSVTIIGDAKRGRLTLSVRNGGASAVDLKVSPNAYAASFKPWATRLAPGASASHDWPLTATRGWYDLTVDAGGSSQRLACRIETGRDSVSDPAMTGPALLTRPV